VHRAPSFFLLCSPQILHKPQSNTTRPRIRAPKLPILHGTVHCHQAVFHTAAKNKRAHFLVHSCGRRPPRITITAGASDALRHAWQLAATPTAPGQVPLPPRPHSPRPPSVLSPLGTLPPHPTDVFIHISNATNASRTASNTAADRSVVSTREMSADDPALAYWLPPAPGST